MMFRTATLEDVPKVLPMVAAIATLHEMWDAAKYGYLPNAVQMYAGWLPTRVTDARSVFLVAEREQKILGFLIATVEKELPIYRVKEFGFIHDLFVDERYRNEGVGRQLTMLAVERFKQLGVPQIRLDTASKNDAARHLFAACGFRPSTTEMLIELT